MSESLAAMRINVGLGAALSVAAVTLLLTIPFASQTALLHPPVEKAALAAAPAAACTMRNASIIVAEVPSQWELSARVSAAEESKRSLAVALSSCAQKAAATEKRQEEACALTLSSERDAAEAACATSVTEASNRASAETEAACATSVTEASNRASVEAKDEAMAACAQATTECAAREAAARQEATASATVLATAVSSAVQVQAAVAGISAERTRSMAATEAAVARAEAADARATAAEALAATADESASTAHAQLRESLEATARAEARPCPLPECHSIAISAAVALFAAVAAALAARHLSGEARAAANEATARADALSARVAEGEAALAIATARAEKLEVVAAESVAAAEAAWDRARAAEACLVPCMLTELRASDATVEEMAVEMQGACAAATAAVERVEKRALDRQEREQNRHYYQLNEAVESERVAMDAASTATAERDAAMSARDAAVAETENVRATMGAHVSKAHAAAEAAQSAAVRAAKEAAVAAEAERAACVFVVGSCLNDAEQDLVRTTAAATAHVAAAQAAAEAIASEAAARLAAAEATALSPAFASRLSTPVASKLIANVGASGGRSGAGWWESFGNAYERSRPTPSPPLPAAAAMQPPPPMPPPGDTAGDTAGGPGGSDPAAVGTGSSALEAVWSAAPANRSARALRAGGRAEGDISPCKDGDGAAGPDGSMTASEASTMLTSLVASRSASRKGSRRPSRAASPTPKTPAERAFAGLFDDAALDTPADGMEENNPSHDDDDDDDDEEEGLGEVATLGLSTAQWRTLLAELIAIQHAATHLAESASAHPALASHTCAAADTATGLEAEADDEEDMETASETSPAAAPLPAKATAHIEHADTDHSLHAALNALAFIGTGTCDPFITFSPPPVTVPTSLATQTPPPPPPPEPQPLLSVLRTSTCDKCATSRAASAAHAAATAALRERLDDVLKALLNSLQPMSAPPSPGADRQPPSPYTASPARSDTGEYDEFRTAASPLSHASPLPTRNRAHLNESPTAPDSAYSAMYMPFGREASSRA